MDNSYAYELLYKMVAQNNLGTKNIYVKDNVFDIKKTSYNRPNYLDHSTRAYDILSYQSNIRTMIYTAQQVGNLPLYRFTLISDQLNYDLSSREQEQEQDNNEKGP